MKSDKGFSLLETLIAVTLLTAGISAAAQLFVVATQANDRAAAITIASLLAQQKIEQLRALTWGFDQSHVAVADTSSNTTLLPVSATGGTGLRSSPAGTLTSDTAGYCDYVDDSGKPIPGVPPAIPDGTQYIRRWAIDRSSANPDTLVVQVRVIPRSVAAGGVILATARTRRPT